MLRRFALARFAFTSLSLVALGRAQTQQHCVTVPVPPSSADWTSLATVPKFDTALGSLVQVDFTLTGDIQGSAAAENSSNAPVLDDLFFQAQFSLSRPDHSILAQANPLALFHDSLGAFDGTVDFAGPSGVTHSGIVASAASVVAQGSPSDVALFSGSPGNPGTVDLGVSVTNLSVLVGSGTAQFTMSAGASVQVCYTFVPDTPPSFAGLPCGSVLMATVGVPLTFSICAIDNDPLDFMTLTGSLPLGATTLPPLPAFGNPACVTVSWTPLPGQLGVNDFDFVATDTHLRSSSCALHTFLGPECYQVLGRGSGNASFSHGGATFLTHLSSVRRAYSVTMADRPSLRIPDLATGQLQLSMQTVMHNPWDFPANPDQWSQRLRVTILPGQLVIGELFDTLDGIHQQIATFTDPLGDRYVTFPFTIDGI